MKHLKNSYSLACLALTALLGCSPENNTGESGAPTANGQSGQIAPANQGAGAAGRASVGGVVTTPIQSGAAGSKAAPAVATGGTSGSAEATSGNAGSSSPVMEGSAGTETAMPTFDFTPTKRDPMFPSLAPELGEPLPRNNMGMWNWIDIEGATSRDGSSAGFYYKFSATGSKNLLVYLLGGGVCPDTSFCNINPANKNQSLTAEGIIVGAGNAVLASPDAEAQDPNLERWQSGIFKNDPANPVRDWNVVFIPYVTGDVFFGSRPDATIPNVEGTFQFVGKTNMQKFLARIIPTFADAQIAMMAGSSAGGIGTLLNITYFADGFIDQGKGARIVVLDDAGPFFEDEYLDVCIQQRYREVFGLNQSFPSDCPDCINADGGGLAKGVLTYLQAKYPGQALGGLVDSNEDEIMKFFFSEGLEKCSYIDNPVVGLLAYPAGDYPKALASLLSLAPPEVMASYVWEGSLHQNLFLTASGDRFYEKNGLDKTVAEWLTDLLAGKSTRIGVVK